MDDTLLFKRQLSMQQYVGMQQHVGKATFFCKRLELKSGIIRVTSKCFIL